MEIKLIPGRVDVMRLCISLVDNEELGLKTKKKKESRMSKIRNVHGKFNTIIPVYHTRLYKIHLPTYLIRFNNNSY